MDKLFLLYKSYGRGSGVARTFLGGRLAHPEGQNEDKNV